MQSGESLLAKSNISVSVARNGIGGINGKGIYSRGLSMADKMPKWIFAAVNGTQRERDLHEAIAIAWEALHAAEKACNDDYCCCDGQHDQHRDTQHCSGHYAKGAISRIAALGGQKMSGCDCHERKNEPFTPMPCGCFTWKHEKDGCPEKDAMRRMVEHIKNAKRLEPGGIKSEA